MAKDFSSSNITLPRGLRNNNPGNLKYFASNKWKGQIGNDGTFAIFSNVAYGIRAFGIDLKGDIKEGTNTIEKLIYEFAPPTENKTETYIKTVVAKAGIPRNQKLNTDISTLIKLARGMFAVELGSSFASMLTDSDIKEGLLLMGSSGSTKNVDLLPILIIAIITLTILFTN